MQDLSVSKKYIHLTFVSFIFPLFFCNLSWYLFVSGHICYFYFTADFAKTFVYVIYIASRPLWKLYGVQLSGHPTQLHYKTLLFRHLSRKGLERHVMTDEQLSFSYLFVSVSLLCLFALYSIRKIRANLTLYAIHLIAQAMIASSLQSYNAVLAGLAVHCKPG